MWQNTYMLFAGREVRIGKTVPEVLSTAGKDAKAGKLVAVRTRGPDGKIRTAGARAISQSDSRI